MTTGVILAIVGLALALIELHFPWLSSRLEAGLTRAAERLHSYYGRVRDTPIKLKNWADRTKSAKYYENYHTKAIYSCVFSYMAFAVLAPESMQIDFWQSALQSVFNVLLIVTAILLILTGLRFGVRSIHYFISLLCGFVSKILYVPYGIIWVANKAGNGKGLSGIGLIMALLGSGTRSVPTIVSLGRSEKVDSATIDKLLTSWRAGDGTVDLCGAGTRDEETPDTVKCDPT